MREVVRLLVWCVLLTGAACGQIEQSAQAPTVAGNQPPRSFADSLRSYGVELSVPSLTAALRNGNPQIRTLAALQLAQEHNFGAEAAIEHALSAETDPTAQVGIASALSALHDPVGVEHLQAMCSDSALSAAVIIDAVQHLQIVGSSSEECVDTVLASLASNADYRADMLTLLPPMYREVPREQSDRILRVLHDLLSDSTQQPVVHMQAGHALAQIGLLSSIEIIRNAIQQEKDAVVRSSLQDDLKTLEKKP